MSILARVLMLVACVPLLQPTGFCLCKAGERGHPSPSGQEPVEAGHTGPAVLNETGCCSHRHCTGDAAARSGEPAPPPCPVPQDDSHTPGCPASAGVDRFKWVEPTASPVHLLPPVEVVRGLPLEVVLVSGPSITTSANWASAPPLYLAHCTLVI
ncbi:MAG: hypothetical protein JWO38_3515 [Gemmataceae bacterium]|nr:hypothetical protein [Gemmataceae bacterium]